MSAFNSGWSSWGGGGGSASKKRFDGGTGAANSGSGVAINRQARQSGSRGTVFFIRFLVIVILVQALYIVKLKVSQQRRLMLEEEHGNNGDAGEKDAGVLDQVKSPAIARATMDQDTAHLSAATSGAGSASSADEKQPTELPGGDKAVELRQEDELESKDVSESASNEMGPEGEMESKDEEEVGSRREGSAHSAEAQAEAGEAEAGEAEAGGRDEAGEVRVNQGEGAVEGQWGEQGEQRGRGEAFAAVGERLAQLRGGTSEGRGGGEAETVEAEGGGPERKGNAEERSGEEGATRGEGTTRGEGGWLPLTGPPEGKSCRAWLGEQDEVAEGREFEKQPIRVAASEVKRWDCDVPCEFVGEGDVDASLTFGVAGKMVLRSMEARSYYPANDPAVSRGSHSVVMTVHYDSDVPVQYGSWEEYDIMRPPVPKTADALAAAFISNCAANNFRLKAVEELQKFFPVHSYGRCLNNRPYEHDKLSVIQRYKFSLAFENSCERDYITEKFWQSLVAGSVPVIIGPPNIADFTPDNNSYLQIQSEADIPRVARQMEALAADEDAYNKMLEWKRSGPSDQFIANVDLSAVHSSCRLCVLLADRIRNEEISSSGKQRPCRCESMSKSGKKQTTYHIYVRERGTYRYTSIFLTRDSLSLPGLRRGIRRAFKKKGYKPVWVGKRPAVLASEERIKALRIFHVYPAGSTQREAMFGRAWFQTSEQFVGYLNGHPCPRLEVIFI